MVKNQIPIPVTVFEENLKGKTVFVADCPLFEIATQGDTKEESLTMIKDAVELYLREPEARKILAVQKINMVSIMTVSMPKRSAYE
jgi:predicted RNase H-like HicB family nuclease